MKRTRGLVAPVPPAHGDLAANGTGWLVGVRGHPLRLPPGVPGVLASLFPSGVSALVGLLHVPLTPMVMVVAGLGPGLGLFLATRWPAGWYLRRRFRRAERPRRLADAAPGTLVRIQGIIASEPAVPTLFRGRPSVLFRNRIGGADETRGIDFSIQMDNGERAKVHVRGAVLIDRPKRTRERPVCGPVSVEILNGVPRLRSDLFQPPPLWRRLIRFGGHESSVGPGDRVEVVGVVHQEPIADDMGAFDRHIPMGFALRQGPAAPLMVRTARP